jgi:FtsH-binding integral membrane protein
VTTIETHADRHSSTDVVAGFLAVASIVLSAVALGAGLILELDARPVRTCVAAGLLALVSARMSAKYEKLALAAILFAMVSWVVGLTLVVVTENPLI